LAWVSARNEVVEMGFRLVHRSEAQLPMIAASGKAARLIQPCERPVEAIVHGHVPYPAGELLREPASARVPGGPGWHVERLGALLKPRSASFALDQQQLQTSAFYVPRPDASSCATLAGLAGPGEKVGIHSAVSSPRIMPTGGGMAKVRNCSRC